METSPRFKASPELIKLVMTTILAVASAIVVATIRTLVLVIEDVTKITKGV
jgi:hypothetical protein